MTRLEQDIARLKQQVLDMGRQAEAMVVASSRALLVGDAAAVAQVHAMEPDVDERQVAIDRETIRLITVYAPVARHLRTLLMLARITSELERIGDQAVDNCEYVELVDAATPGGPLTELAEMSRLAEQMVAGALRALEAEDNVQARAVMRLDDQVDAVNARIIQRALSRTLSGDELASQCLGALVARSVERIADHATNICEEVFYLVSGEDIRQPT